MNKELYHILIIFYSIYRIDIMLIDRAQWEINIVVIIKMISI